MNALSTFSSAPGLPRRLCRAQGSWQCMIYEKYKCHSIHEKYCLSLKNWDAEMTACPCNSRQNLEIVGNLMSLLPNHLILVTGKTESWLSVTDEYRWFRASLMKHSLMLFEAELIRFGDTARIFKNRIVSLCLLVIAILQYSSFLY